MLDTAVIYIRVEETQSQRTSLRRELEYIVIRISSKAREPRLVCKFRSWSKRHLGINFLHGRSFARVDYNSANISFSNCTV